jgi:hypothetical protein
MNSINTIPNAGILKVVLTAFLGARIDTVIDENGNEEKCVCIPIDRNGLRIGSTGKVTAYAFVVKTRNANRYGWTHYLKMKCHPNFVKKINGLGFEVPYLGNIKPASFIVHKKSYQNELSGQKVKVKDYE